MILSIISAIGKNNEIGKNNSLLWSLPADMKHFKDITTGHPIVMGQKTFESIGKPLPNRRNIILTLDRNFKKDGCEIIHSPVELYSLFKDQEENEEVFVIGGGQIYKLFINEAKRLYITYVEDKFPEADVFFPEIDESKWSKESEEIHEPDEKNKYQYSFVKYLRK